MTDLESRTETRTPHQMATSEFLARIAEVAGVRCVQAEDGPDDGITCITVHVESLRSEAARQVFDLETVIRRKFRGSNFTVRVRESTPLNLTADES
jgi:hypothetical protein